MDAVSWGIFALAAAGALAVVGYLYRVRETPGRGRTLLAAIRWAVLAILILLLFDPELPVPGRAAGGPRTRVLVDASLSMALPAAPGDSVTRWQRAATEAARLAGGSPVLLFGDATEQRAGTSLDSVKPEGTASRLLPALRVAAESGARQAVVLTDGGVEDAEAVSRMLPRLGLDVEVRPIGAAGVGNRALAEVDAPAWAEAGKPFHVRVGVAALGAAGDSVSVVIRRDGEEVGRAPLVTAAPGRVAGTQLEFTPEAPPGGGLVRYDVALEPADAEPADDARSLYVYVGERPAAVAVVSFRPDWEPRFLQPVLAQALGLPIRGYLHAADDRYVQLGAGGEAGNSVAEREVRRAVERADLLVLHGVGPDAPAWAREAAAEKRHVLVFPAEDARELALPVRLSPVAAGEWYASADVPASPLAPMLVALRTDGLPPLVGLRPIEPSGGAWTPLAASRNRRGAGSPVLIAGERDGRRWAVATASGFWRWAFRGGEARRTYRRLWASLAGWLVQEEQSLADAAIRPARRVVARGEPVHWTAPGLAADSLALKVSDAAGAVVMDTVVAMARGDSAVTRALPPGHYSYQARAFAGDEEKATATGPLSVESYSPEFTRAATALAGFTGADARQGAPGPRSGEPLHTTPWPYLLLVLLVSSEWVLRRRWGLR